MESLKDLLSPKTVNKFSFIANGFWLVLGVVLSSVFMAMETNEPRFPCDAKDDHQELTQVKCYEQYEKRYNKLSIPIYAFVIINFFISMIASGIYSQYVKSRISELEQQHPLQPHQERPPRKLFKAYCFQLVARFILGILCISLQKTVFYPQNFPSNFTCDLMVDDQQSENNTKTRTYECHNQRATKKNSWMYVVIVVNGIFAVLVLIEIAYILLRVMKCRRFMEDFPFYAFHLTSHASSVHPYPLPSSVQQEQSPLQQQQPLMQEQQSPQQQQQSTIQEQQTSLPFYAFHLTSHASSVHPYPLPSSVQQEQSPLQQQQPLMQEQQSPQQQQQSTIQEQQTSLQGPLSSPLQASIKAMRDNVKEKTKRLKDLESPFRHNHGEGNQTAKGVEIYTNMIIHEGRIGYDFHTNRQEQLKAYPKPCVNSPPIQPRDIVDGQHINVLVVGRPGIGKTLLCNKILREWASNIPSTETQHWQLQFEVAFLLKFRRFNSRQDPLTLRELLAYSEYSTIKPDDAVVWEHILENPTKVLLIFDGIDEYKTKENLVESHDSDHRNSDTEKMPFAALYNKLASGDLLTGATILTTIRPTAVSCVRYLDFDRAVEILGFTPEQVEDCVKKWTKGEQEGTGQAIWEHISSNINIFSLCYVPVNCIIICTCLLHVLENLESSSPYVSRRILPAKLTVIYSMAIKIFYFKHNEKYRYSKKNIQDFMYKSFANLPNGVKADFERLGKIAFRGIKEGRLIFESEEVEGLEDCALLHRLPDLKAPDQRPFEMPKAQFCFMHLTIQEFLAAKHVTDTLNEEEMQKFVSDRIGQGTWQVVLQFVAGLLNRGAASRIFVDALPVSTQKQPSDSVKLTSWPVESERFNAVTLCMCLNEIDVDDPTLQTKLRGIDFKVADFSNCQLGLFESSSVVNLLKRHRVIWLALNTNNLGPLDCKQIQLLLASSDNNDAKLRKLNLAFNEIKDEGVEILAEALTHSDCKLKILNLSLNHISNEGVTHLAHALTHSNCKLKSLNLSDNSVNDNGVKDLAEALTHRNCKLTNLNLSGNQVSSEGAQHLATSLNHRNCELKRLNLSNNKIKAKGAGHLTEALSDGVCKLESLDISRNGISNEYQKFLAAVTHSNCKIYWLRSEYDLLQGGPTRACTHGCPTHEHTFSPVFSRDF